MIVYIKCEQDVPPGLTENSRFEELPSQAPLILNAFRVSAEDFPLLGTEL